MAQEKKSSKYFKMCSGELMADFHFSTVPNNRSLPP